MKKEKEEDVEAQAAGGEEDGVTGSINWSVGG